ncbi:hypothetical protein MKX78_19770 [Cytobacillus sp. FSL R5-0569]|uniref:hypothetical protein n=1 Tax=unclassified Cytobacillus TaxID=2675268 RepID=UPI0030FA492D
MPKQILDYQYIDGNLEPFYFIIKPYKGEINWNKNVFHFDLLPPIISKEFTNFDETLINCTISLSELIVNKDIKNRIGINLKSIKHKLTPDIHDPSIIEQFIIYAPDLLEVIGTIPNEKVKTFHLTNS